MKTKMRPRYYCDHCGKGTGSPSYMRRHEAGCTKNPDRVCGMCAMVGQASGKHKAGIEAWSACDGNYKEKMGWVRNATGNCPACILATLRQVGAFGILAPAEEPCLPSIDDPIWESVTTGLKAFGFDFRAESDAWIRAVNEAEARLP